MSEAATSGGTGADARRPAIFGIVSPHFRYSGQRLSRRGENPGDEDEIVGGRREDEKPLNQIAAAMAGFAQRADGLHPSERFFDLLLLDQADAAAVVTSGSPVDHLLEVAGQHPAQEENRHPPRYAACNQSSYPDSHEASAMRTCIYRRGSSPKDWSLPGQV
jgi:hypothetical protein